MSLFHGVGNLCWKTQKLGPGTIQKPMHSHVWWLMLTVGWGISWPWSSVQPGFPYSMVTGFQRWVPERKPGGNCILSVTYLGRHLVSFLQGMLVRAVRGHRLYLWWEVQGAIRTHGTIIWAFKKNTISHLGVVLGEVPSTPLGRKTGTWVVTLITLSSGRNVDFDHTARHRGTIRMTFCKLGLDEGICLLSQSLRVAITKYQKLGWLMTSITYFSQFLGLEVWKQGTGMGRLEWQLPTADFLSPHMVGREREVSGSLL